MDKNYNFEGTETQEVAMDITTPLEVLTKECPICHKEFTIPPVEQKFYISHGYHIPNKCLDCRKADRELHTFTCVDCNKEFTLKGSELRYYKDNNMELPKRCKPCIQYKREKNKAKEV